MASAVIDLKAKRTQAVAPRSLFGTVIEVTNEDDQRKAAALPVPQRHTQPDKLAKFMPRDASSVMRGEKQETERQIHKARFASDNLKEASHLALHFHPNPDTVKSSIPEGALTYKPKSHYAPYKHDIKLHSRDIQLADEFNRLGIDDHPDYNYERYRRPYTHGSFQLAGTVLGKGGQFKNRDRPNAMQQSFPPTRRRRRVPDIAQALGQGHRAYPQDPPIPHNIRSLHGEELCREIEQKDEIPWGPSPQQKRIPGPLITAKFPSVTPANVATDPCPMYKALGTSLKQDIFNGVSHSHVKSLYNASFTQDPHNRSVQGFPPKFAILKNNDSKWNEDVVIRQRIFKAWDAMVLLRQQEKQGGNT